MSLDRGKTQGAATSAQRPVSNQLWPTIMGDVASPDQASKGNGRQTHILRCVECHAHSTTTSPGWRGIRCDVPDEDDAPVLAFYCPTCAEREFGTGRIPGLDSASDLTLDDPSASA